MCGIFGSNTREQFYELYKLNRSRGSYSSGIYCYRGAYSFVAKTDEEISFESLPDNMEYYLGHNRAPTAETSIFTEDTCHPFHSDYYWYAHNGIINNHKELTEKYDKNYKVDSEWIGFYLDKHYYIDDALQEISNNPFAVWVVRRNLPRTFTLARVANPIYRSLENSSFSSAYFENSELLKEGTIYLGTSEKIINTLETFKYKTPYFIPG